MSDEELIKLAAKAAGYTLVDDIDGNGNYWPWCVELGDQWHPLSDSVNAFMLAVDLDFAVVVDRRRNNVRIDGPSPEALELWNEPIGDDPYAAVRRAITCAAAELGKKL